MKHRREVSPLLKRKLAPRSIFAPGMKIRMNIVPMFLALVVPWAVFTLCCGLTAFRLMYYHPVVVIFLLGGICAFCLASIIYAVWARRRNPDPTWFSYFALLMGLAALAGTLVGMQLYKRYTKSFLQFQDLNVVRDVDAGSAKGGNVMDAGALFFAPGTRIDEEKSSHFKQQTLYCVAPIVSSHLIPETQSYDFWVVGKDCCSTSSSDFRCGAWDEGRARSGIRILDDADLAYYRLAVQQAESTFNIMAKHPIFIEWSLDPVKDMAARYHRLLQTFISAIAMAFIVGLFCLCVAIIGFSFLGRGASRYTEPYYMDHAHHQHGGFAGPGYSGHSHGGPIYMV